MLINIQHRLRVRVLNSISCFLSDQQLHPECDTGAGHPAGQKPRSATSMHHAGHWCHEETGKYHIFQMLAASLFVSTQPPVIAVFCCYSTRSDFFFFFFTLSQYVFQSTAQFVHPKSLDKYMLHWVKPGCQDSIRHGFTSAKRGAVRPF